MKNKTTVHILYVHIFLLLSPEPTRLIERQPLGAVGISQPEEIARLAPVTSDAVGVGIDQTGWTRLGLLGAGRSVGFCSANEVYLKSQYIAILGRGAGIPFLRKSPIKVQGSLEPGQLPSPL